MANVLVDESTLKSIAESIRNKTKKTELLLPSEMPNEIAEIQGEVNDELLRSLIEGEPIELIIPDGTTKISIYFTPSRSGITPMTVVIPDSVTEIVTGAFAGASTIENLSIGSGIETADTSVFPGLSNLKTLKLNCGAIGIGTFSGCSKLTDVAIGDNVASIGSDAFKNCIAIENLSVGSGIGTFDSSVFSDCIGLKWLYINCDKITSPFNSFKNLAELTIGDNVTAISAISSTAFRNCPNLRRLSIGSGVQTRIENSMFGTGYNDNPSETSNIEYLYINCNNIREGGGGYSPTNGTYMYGTFMYCKKLRDVVIGDNVTLIPDMAFYGCDSLTNVTFDGTPSSVDGSAFYGCNNIADIYVPWAEGEVADAPWGAINATIHYDCYTRDLK